MAGTEVRDAYCILSGVSSSGGPRRLFNRYQSQEDVKFIRDAAPVPSHTFSFAKKLAIRLNENRKQLPSNYELPSLYELEAIMLDFFFQNEQGNPPLPSTYFSCGSSMLVMGDYPDIEDLQFFKGNNDSPAADNPRYFEGYNSKGGFIHYEYDRELRYQYLRNSQMFNDKCACMDKRCWDYLQIWVDLPAHGPENPGLPAHIEFWQVIKNGCTSLAAHTHPDIDYGVMKFNWPKSQSFALTDFESLCLKNVPYLSESIALGLRGADLSEAVYHDFRVWIYQTPDIWPERDEHLHPVTFTSFRPSQAQNMHPIITLPNELILDICSRMSITDLLNISSTCRAYRQRVTGHELLSTIVYEMIHFGSLRWIKPCASVYGEVERANEALVTWIDAAAGKDDPLHEPSFPILAFVWTCCVKSTSMKSRRRLWGISKQFETMWITYRRGRRNN
ncbi:hypothetical protein DL96DRAFT_1688480 [Flagelloscypha sp. PMI_526]|nr:hypothetical protein DL96DRAFT_1688480 [Flagelloscypha sp. PMI_526]